MIAQRSSVYCTEIYYRGRGRGRGRGGAAGGGAGGGGGGGGILLDKSTVCKADAASLGLEAALMARAGTTM